LSLRFRLLAIAAICLGTVPLEVLAFQQVATPQQAPQASPTQQNAPPPPGGAQNTPRPQAKAVAANGGYPDYDPARIERGKNIYQSNCSFCHGANAKGGESGPNLVRSLVVLNDANGEKIGEVVHNGRVEKGMPKFPFNNEQILDIATFLHNQVKAASLRGNYQVLNIVTGDPKKGEAYFNGAGKCSSCHSTTGDLAHIGSKYEALEVQQHIVMPRERRGKSMSPAVRVKATVALPSGESVTGFVDHIDDFTVAIIDQNGDYRSFSRDGDVPKVTLTDPMKGHTELLKTYTDADIHNLTAYLVTLK
jgi:cytochrome c oxidase cbb3-type subunit III